MDRHSSNEQLLSNPDIFKKIANNELVLIDKIITSNPEYTTLYFIGKIIFNGDDDSLSEASCALLGWNPMIVERIIQNAKTDISNSMNIGSSYDDWAIRIIDDIKPNYDNHTPRVDNDGNIFFYNNNEIYRRKSICTKQELRENSHKILKITSRGNKLQSNVNIDSLFTDNNTKLEKVISLKLDP